MSYEIKGDVDVKRQLRAMGGKQANLFLVDGEVDFTTAEPAHGYNQLYVNTVTGNGSVTAADTFTAGRLYRSAGNSWFEIQPVAGYLIDNGTVVKRYDGASWVSVGGASGLNDLTDVDLTTTPPVANDVLTYDGANWVPVSGGATQDLDNWATTTVYAVGDLVIDTVVGEVFRCLQNHTAGATPPSQDPVNWLGLDVEKLGLVSIAPTRADQGPNLIMLSGRSISRAKYNRLLEKIAPVLSGNSIVSGTTALGLAPGSGAYALVGATIEGVGIPSGTTITTVSAEGVKTGSNLTTGSVINWKPGVLGTGYVIQPGIEVAGGGIGVGATTQSAGSTPDSTVSINNGLVGLGTNYIAGPTTYTHSQTLVAGDYVSHAAVFPVDTRVTRFQNRVVSTGTAARTETSSPLIALTPAFESIVDLTNTTAPMVGRRISGTGIPGNTSVVAVTKPTYHSVTVGNWDWVSTIGFFSPWDVDPADESEAVTPYVRRMSGGPVTDAVAASIVSVQASGSALAGTLSGDTGLFWHTGATLPAVTTNLKVGSATPGIATDTYLTVGIAGNEESVNIGTLDTVSRIFYATGAPQVGVEGRYVTRLDVGINQARITGTPVAQFNRTNASISAGDDKLHLQPGSINANHAVGQFISGTGIPANTRIAAFDPEATVSNSLWLNGSALFSVQPGEAQTFVVGQRVTGTGRTTAAANAILSVAPEVTRQCVGVPNSSNIFLETGESHAEVVDRMIIDDAGWAPNTFALGIVSAVAAAPPQANVRMNVGGNIAFYPATFTSALPPAITANGCAKFSGGEPGFTYSRIVSANVPFPNPVAITSGSNVFTLGPNLFTGAADSFASPAEGRGVAIPSAGIANGRIASQVVGTATGAANWTTTFGNVVNITGWTGRALSAADVGLYVVANIPGIGNRVARITEVLSSNWFRVNSSEIYGASGVTTIIGPRFSVVDDAGLPLNATTTIDPSGNASASIPAPNATLGAFVTLAETNTSGSIQYASMDGLAYMPLVNAAGTSTTPTGNALFTGPVTFGARYQLSGNSTAANSFGTATVGAMATMSNLASLTSTTLSSTFGRWADISAPANADTLPGPTVLGPVSTMSAPATATLDGESVGWGAYIAVPPASSQGTLRGSIANVKFGGVLELSANSTSQQFPEVTFGMIVETDQVASAASTAAFTVGGHTALDVANTADAVDAVYSFGVGIIMSQAATATDPAVDVRLFPYGAGDGATTFGIESSTTVGGKNLSIYAGA